jgi:hypothetical protein
MAGVGWSKPLSPWLSLVTEDADSGGLGAAGISAAAFGQTGSKVGGRRTSAAIVGTDSVAARTLTGRPPAVVPFFESTVLRAIRVGRRIFDAAAPFFLPALRVRSGWGSGRALAATGVTAFVRFPAARTLRDRLPIGALFGFIQRFRLGGRGCF